MKTATGLAMGLVYFFGFVNDKNHLFYGFLRIAAEKVWIRVEAFAAAFRSLTPADCARLYV